MPVHLMALEQAAQPAAAASSSDGALRSAIVNVAKYYLQLATTRTPAQMEALIWSKDSLDKTQRYENAKSDAANAVKGIPGIDSVDNQIEVLPNSPNDDRIRAAVYNRIYTQPSLRKYNANQGSLAQAMGPGGRRFALMAGGITNDPPIGFHAIHIIVKNGNVTLYGVVNNEMDSAIAGIQANSAPGAFSVDNDLIVQGSAPKPAAAK